MTAPSSPAPETLTIDDNYRLAIAQVEQADRLINQATGSADLVLGEQKLTQAKEHIDELPKVLREHESRRDLSGG